VFLIVSAFKELFPACVKKTNANVKQASDFILVSYIMAQDTLAVVGQGPVI